MFGWSWATERGHSEGRCWKSCAGPRTPGGDGLGPDVSLSKNQDPSLLMCGEVKNGMLANCPRPLANICIYTYSPHMPLYRHVHSPRTWRYTAHMCPPPRISSSPCPLLHPLRERRACREGWAGHGVGGPSNLGLTCTKCHMSQIRHLTLFPSKTLMQAQKYITRTKRYPSPVFMIE